MNRRPWLILILTLMLGLTACGYRLQGRDDRLPDGARYVYVEMFRNRTYEPFLENAVTNAVVDRLARSPGAELVEQPERADALLSGTIVDYRNYALAYDAGDRIAEYRSVIRLDAVLRRADTAQVLWKGKVSWTEDYLASPDKTLERDREQAVIAELSRRLADELYSRLMDAF